MNVWRDWLFHPFSLLIFFWGASLFLMLVIGNPLIAWLKGLKGMKWSPREDTPDSHLQKAGVPSMGGIGIIGSALIVYIAVSVFYASLDTPFFPSPSRIGLLEYSFYFLLPAVTLGHALLGFRDDWLKASGKGGLLAWQKLLGQIILACVFVGIFGHFAPDEYPIDSYTSWRNMWFSWPLLLLTLIGTSNAVNLTDGIDGLAAGLAVQCGVAFFIALGFDYSVFLRIGLLSITAAEFWLCIGGACLGFLAFNKNPAKVFMGDTGSLALGAALGAGAILTRSVFLLPFIGFIFFVEMFSVISQVAYFKFTKKKYGEGKRIFRRAPLHHHFELAGWSEWRVVVTFWAVNALATIIGLILWMTGVIPRFPYDML